jgi:preprotein translocase SecE subunit
MGVVEYVKATQGEMRHVTWPNRRQVALYTATVVAISLGVAALLGVLDFGFLRVLRGVIGSGESPVATTTPAEFAPEFEIETLESDAERTLPTDIDTEAGI